MKYSNDKIVMRNDIEGIVQRIRNFENCLILLCRMSFYKSMFNFVCLVILSRKTHILVNFVFVSAKCVKVQYLECNHILLLLLSSLLPILFVLRIHAVSFFLNQHLIDLYFRIAEINLI